MSLEPAVAPTANVASGETAAPAPAAQPAIDAAPAAEAKPAEVAADKPVAEKEAQATGTQVAAMVRREQEIARKAQELAKKQSELKAQIADGETYRKVLEAAKKDPLAAAEMLQLDYDAITRARLDRAKAVVTPDDLKRELDAREKARQEAESQRIAEAQRAAQAAQEKEAQEALDAYRAEAKAALDATPDAYELLRDHATVFGVQRAEDLVVQIAREHFIEQRKANPHARPPSAKEANDLAEKWLEERAKRLLSAKKLAPPPAEKAKPPVTLSNDLGPSTTGRVDKPAGSGDPDFGSIEWMMRRAREIENENRKT